MADGTRERFGAPQSIEAAVSHDSFFGPEVDAQLEQIAGGAPAPEPTPEQRARRRWNRSAREFLLDMRRTHHDNELIALGGVVDGAQTLGMWEGAPRRACEMLAEAQVRIGNRWMHDRARAEQQGVR